MEPSGRNRWQSVANRPTRKITQTSQTVAVGCHGLPELFHGKEGVDGSSPSEGSAKAPQIGAFVWRELARSPACGGYGALYGAFRFRADTPKHRKWTYSPGLPDGAPSRWARRAAFGRPCWCSDGALSRGREALRWIFQARRASQFVSAGGNTPQPPERAFRGRAMVDRL